MLAAFSSLLRRHGSVRHQFTGAALQSAADCTSVDLLNGNGSEEHCPSIRALNGAAASTSCSLLSSKKGIASPLSSGHTFGCFGVTARHASSASESHTARRREILRDAAQKVPAGSTWLLAYSHNIDPRQLTFRLGKRSTLHGLEEAWALYQQKFDTVAMAALLRRVRVAQLYDPDFDAASAQRLLNALEPRLRSITIRFGKLRDTIAYLHALAKLRSPPPSAPAGVAGLPESDSDDAAAGTQPGEQVLLGQPAELVLDLAAWATRDRNQMLHASPRRLATLLWALLRTVPPELYGSEKLQMVLDRVALCSIRQWRNFAPQDMRVYAMSYATFGPRGVPLAATAGPDDSWRKSGRSWLGSVSSWPQPEQKRPLAANAGGEAGAAATAATGGDAAGSADGSGGGTEVKAQQRLKRNALVMQVVADHLASRVGDLTVAQPEPRDLALSAHALALQGAPTPHWPLLIKAADAVAASPHRLQPLELVLLVEALAAYGVRQPVLLDAVRQRAAQWAGSEPGAGGEPAGSAAAATNVAGGQGPQQLYGRLARAYEHLGVSL